MFLAILTFYYGIVVVHDNEIRNQLLKCLYNEKNKKNYVIPFGQYKVEGYMGVIKMILLL